jgi:hypothetical protein
VIPNYAVVDFGAGIFMYQHRGERGYAAILPRANLSATWSRVRCECSPRNMCE